jgi:hypothetical protein
MDPCLRRGDSSFRNRNELSGGGMGFSILIIKKEKEPSGNRRYEWRRSCPSKSGYGTETVFYNEDFQIIVHDK